MIAEGVKTMHCARVAADYTPHIAAAEPPFLGLQQLSQAPSLLVTRSESTLQYSVVTVSCHVSCACARMDRRRGEDVEQRAFDVVELRERSVCHAPRHLPAPG
jgi:hypothetical protein